MSCLAWCVRKARPQHLLVQVSVPLVLLGDLVPHMVALNVHHVHRAIPTLVAKHSVGRVGEEPSQTRLSPDVLNAEKASFHLKDPANPVLQVRMPSMGRPRALNATVDNMQIPTPVQRLASNALQEKAAYRDQPAVQCVHVAEQRGREARVVIHVTLENMQLSEAKAAVSVMEVTIQVRDQEHAHNAAPARCQPMEVLHAMIVFGGPRQTLLRTCARTAQQARRRTVVTLVASSVLQASTRVLVLSIAISVFLELKAVTTGLVATHALMELWAKMACRAQIAEMDPSRLQTKLTVIIAQLAPMLSLATLLAPNVQQDATRQVGRQNAMPALVANSVMFWAHKAFPIVRTAHFRLV